ASEPRAVLAAGGDGGVDVTPAQARGDELAQVHQMLPGMGEPEPVRIHAGSPALNRTLADLDLRSQTGATVLAITRGKGSVLIPTGREVVREGDVLALAGSQEALAAARKALGEGERDRHDGQD
ncbi:MAG TPA: TrkA C-terminal domain-containing protein, partial [Gemmatimonadaceae bacterium]|nr:TrkA C-terminal domain-containing protein [Gemmatimonadaceae bacterium]